MAFPVTRSAFAGTQGTNANPWTLTYPSSGDILDGGSNAIEAGDLILINIGRDGSSGTGSITGYTLLFNSASGTACRGLTFAKVATGSESGTFSYTVGASEQGAWRVAVIKNWHGVISGGVQVSTAATGTSTAPNPPSLSPSWGAADTFWRAVVAHDDGRRSTTAWPSSPDNFSLYQNSDSSAGSGGAGMGSAGLTKNASSVDPGAFTLGGSVAWVSWLIAVRPAAPVTHAATGSLSSGTASITGASARTSPAVSHAASGALTSQGAVASGSAGRFRGHGTSGVLTGQSADLTGASVRFRAHGAVGGLAGEASSISGSADRIRVFSASGVVVGGGASVAGGAARVSAAVTHSASGSLNAGLAAVNGSASRLRAFTANGVLGGGNAAIAASATNFTVHTATGALAGEAGGIAGVAQRVGGPVAHSATGTISGTGGALVGAASIAATHIVSGALVSAGAYVSAEASGPEPAASVSKARRARVAMGGDRGMRTTPMPEVSKRASRPATRGTRGASGTRSRTGRS